MSAAKKLRTLLAGNRALIAPAVFNPLSAKLAEAAGFEVLYLGGGTIGYLNGCLEANLNITQLCQVGIEIRAASNLPLILDGAAGFGDPMHMHHTITMAEAAGFAAIEIEDQILPKRAHHHVRRVSLDHRKKPSSHRPCICRWWRHDRSPSASSLKNIHSDTRSVLQAADSPRSA